MWFDSISNMWVTIRVGVWMWLGAGHAGQVAHVSPPFSDGYDGKDDQAVVNEVGVVVRQRRPVIELSVRICPCQH